MSAKSHKILATFGQLTTDLDNAKVLLNKMGRKVYRSPKDSKLNSVCSVSQRLQHSLHCLLQTGKSMTAGDGPGLCKQLLALMVAFPFALGQHRRSPHLDRDTRRSSSEGTTSR